MKNKDEKKKKPKEDARGVLEGISQLQGTPTPRFAAERRLREGEDNPLHRLQRMHPTLRRARLALFRLLCSFLERKFQ